MSGRPPSINGILDVTRRGVGYLEHADFDQDLEIAPEDLATALNGDEVEAVVTGNSRGRTRGKVVKVLTRARDVFVGTLVATESSAFTLKADDQRFYPILRIGTSAAHGAKAGDKVLAKIVRWTAGTDPVGEVTEVIGTAGLHETEMRAAVLSRGHKIGFPDEVTREAEHIETHGLTGGYESPERRDFRSVPTFTIDPEDAKDFDDALSVRPLENGLVEVGVHIADVTHYVRPGSALDREARSRATSLYLVDRTIPMLPEALSNGLCSLNPDVDRFTFSAVFTLDERGVVHDTWFGKTLIHSHKRFTYQSAQDVLDQGQGPHHKELSTLMRLGRILRKQREVRGALSFETDEVRFKLAEDGTPLSVYVKQRLETMKMIEDWMLLANQEVARFVSNLVKDKRGPEQTFIYRIHDTPDSDRIEELRIFLKAVGYDLGHGRDVHSRDINALLAKAKGTPEEAVIQMATLRSMAKAVYSHKNIGHFSLSFSHYTHFTSPIRRYADVIAHRILASHLDKKPLSHEELIGYQRAAVHASEREVAAVEAERESIKYKQVEYMVPRKGEVFDATITGVTENGLFVAEKASRAEGLVHISSIKDDYYHFVPKQYALTGNKKRRTFRMGDSVRVKLLNADLEARRIDWVLAT